MSTTPLTLPPGTRVGNYDVEAVLGVGGMAVVYQATHRTLRRSVALKVLNPRLAADRAFRERFRREGEHIAALDHPHVVPVFDAGEFDGRLYLAMRLLRGGTLADRLADPGVTPPETLGLLTPVAGALDAAHAAGLLHRDIKPQNILLGDAGHVYLADFGIAKDLDQTSLTVGDGLLGSVRYVAPEQIRGEPPTAAADVYSLAIVAYECLTGRVPFGRGGAAEIIDAQLSQAPAALRPAADAAAQAAWAALAVGLAKDPADRMATASELLEELRAALSGASGHRLRARPGFPGIAPLEPTAEGPPPTSPGAGAPPRAGTGTEPGVGTGTAVLPWPPSQPPRPADAVGVADAPGAVDVPGAEPGRPGLLARLVRRRKR
jgi:serine/threonine protein kinase